MNAARKTEATHRTNVANLEGETQRDLLTIQSQQSADYPQPFEHSVAKGRTHLMNIPLQSMLPESLFSRQDPQRQGVPTLKT